MATAKTIPSDIDPAPDPEQTPPHVPASPQADGTPTASTQEGHIGAREDQVSDTTPPAGKIYKDEPKQG